MNVKEAFFDYAFGLCKEVFELVKYGKAAIPVNYYARHNNWGDQVNPYIVNKITGVVVRKVQRKSSKHLLCVGSVLSTASENSIIWGSGFISNDITLKTNKINVCAVRGHLTRKRLLEEYNLKNDIALGDPVVLMKDFYNPEINKKYKIGIVAHYKDKDLPSVRKLLELGVGLINIQSDTIESFIDDILQYEYVFSSSLHGLIVADVYEIPNIRLVLSNYVKGGDFKFLDYYSTTDNQAPDKLIISDDCIDLDFIEQAVKKCSVSNFIESKDALKNSFPAWCFHD